MSSTGISENRTALRWTVATLLAAGLSANPSLDASAQDVSTGVPEASIAASLPPELADPGGVRRHESE